jgi:plasmid stabilization system protein ParE
MKQSYPILLLPEAKADLIRLHDFISEHNPKAAGRAAKSISDNIKKLALYPLLVRQVIDLNIPELRDLFVAFGQAGYIVRYLVKHEQIIIVKIWSSRENR